MTIATNMAGRGVDIRINDEVRDLGGLYIIGTERHESRRIDNQLRGRAGRQGDPGMSRFYLSLEDNLLRIFGSDRIKAIMDRLGIDEGESIESRMVTRAVENAQKKVESLHFEARKHLLEYDDVGNEQRKTIYKYRDELLDKNYDMSEKIAQNRVEYATNLLDTAEIFHGGLKDDFDIKNLCSIILADCGEEIDESELKGLEYNELVEKIHSGELKIIDLRNKRLIATLADYNVKLTKEDCDYYYKKQFEFILDAISPNEKLNSILEELSRNYKLIILTNGKSHEQRKKLKKLQLEDLFKVYISEEVHISKPKPQAFLNVLEKEGINIKFKKQLSNDKIGTIIKKIV